MCVYISLIQRIVNYMNDALYFLVIFWYPFAKSLHTMHRPMPKAVFSLLKYQPCRKQCASQCDRCSIHARAPYNNYAHSVFNVTIKASVHDGT